MLRHTATSFYDCTDRCARISVSVTGFVVACAAEGQKDCAHTSLSAGAKSADVVLMLVLCFDLSLWSQTASIAPRDCAIDRMVAPASVLQIRFVKHARGPYIALPHWGPFC